MSEAPSPGSGVAQAPSPVSTEVGDSEQAISVGITTSGSLTTPVAATEPTSHAEQIWNGSLVALLSVCCLLALAPRGLAVHGSVGRGIVTARLGFLVVAFGAFFILAAQYVGERLG